MGTAGGQQEVADARKQEAPRNPGLTLVKISHKGEGEPVENISRGEAWTPVEGWGHPPSSNILTQNCSCLREIQGQRGEQRLKEKKDHPETAPPGDPSHIETPNPDNIAHAKKCLLTGC